MSNYETTVYSFNYIGGWYPCESYNEPQARLAAYQSFQNNIEFEIQEYLDKGWEPVGTIGPGNVSLRTEKKYFDWDAWGWIMYLVVGFGTFGIGLLIIPLISTHWGYIPVNFSVSFRRSIS